jgi:hypothetical protein
LYNLDAPATRTRLLGQFDTQHTVVACGTGLLGNDLDRKPEGAPETAEGALPDAIMPIALLLLDALFTANDQRIAPHFQTQALLDQSRYLKENDDPLTILVKIAGQQPPVRGKRR